jgi:murein DD-endopeptidase MepM/ murein hydrolase activator NlpD
MTAPTSSGRLRLCLVAPVFVLGGVLEACSPALDPPLEGSGGSEALLGGRNSGGRTSAGGMSGVGGSSSGGSANSGGTRSGGGGGLGTGSGGTGGSDGIGGESASGGETASGGGGMCDGECRFVWPIEGEVSADWTVANYVDLEPGAGVLDYREGARSYDGHMGVDIAIASFRTMDRGITVHAVAPGTVLSVHDGEEDRNTVADISSCNLRANSIFIRHLDGREARYLHFRRDSIVVEAGQTVQAGDELGEVGSSGCSGSPHVHIEVLEENGELVDPFQENLWLAPPDYDAPPKVMEVILIAGGVSSVAEVQNAPPSPTTLEAARPFGISVITGGTAVGTLEEVTFYRDGLYNFNLEPFTFEGTETHYMRWWEPVVVSGAYRVDVKLNGELVRTLEFTAE